MLVEIIINNDESQVLIIVNCYYRRTGLCHNTSLHGASCVCSADWTW